MTEDEARTKLCPHFNGWISSNESVDRFYKCKGSACMMWKWTRYPRTEPVNFREMADWDNVADAKGAGGCGLAGERT
jgi:hypothetical protein